MYSGIFDEQHVLASKELLVSDSFYQVCKSVVINWPICTENALTAQVGKKSWLGQAACNYNHKASEVSTREAWSRLTTAQKLTANNIAQKVINEYEKSNRSLHSGMGKEVLC